MSQKKMNQAFILTRLVEDRGFTITEAAQAMGLSERQTKRLKKAFKEEGVKALVHKNIGRTPANAVDEATRTRIIELKQTEPMKKANIRFFQEIISRPQYGIHLSYSTLYGILSEAGLRSVRANRAPQKHRSRKRKAREGLMLQIDASPYDWLSTGEMFSLHGAIDDATSTVTSLYLSKNECLQGYFEVMRATIVNKGIPLSIYADRHTIFMSPKSGRLTIEDELNGISVQDTQFGRALRQLGITLLNARSPQAKGRVERLWETLQGRLPIELALANITSVDEANNFLKGYLETINAQFGVPPEKTVSAYRPLSVATNLDNILCVVEKRMMDNGGVFSFHNQSYQLVSKRNDRLLPKKGKVDVLVSPYFGIRAAYLGVVYDVSPFARPQKTGKPLTEKKKGKYIPPDSHYYKYGHALIKKITFEDDDTAILKILERVFLGKMDDAV